MQVTITALATTFSNVNICYFCNLQYNFLVISIGTLAEENHVLRLHTFIISYNVTIKLLRFQITNYVEHELHKIFLLVSTEV